MFYRNRRIGSNSILLVLKPQQIYARPKFKHDLMQNFAQETNLEDTKEY